MNPRRESEKNLINKTPECPWVPTSPPRSPDREEFIGKYFFKKAIDLKQKEEIGQTDKDPPLPFILYSPQPQPLFYCSFCTLPATYLLPTCKPKLKYQKSSCQGHCANPPFWIVVFQGSLTLNWLFAFLLCNLPYIMRLVTNSLYVFKHNYINILYIIFYAVY